MAVLMSSGLCKALLDKGSLKSAFSGVSAGAGYIDIYECELDDIPPSADNSIDPAKHRKLLRFYSDRDGLGLGVAVGGEIEKAVGETWYGTAVETGSATFFRYVRTSDNGGFSDNNGWSAYGQARLQGLVGVSGADLNMDSTNVVAGDAYIVRNFVIGWE